MTQSEKELHDRMNAAIVEALANLRADFDVTDRDVKQDRAEWDIIRSKIKQHLWAAYLRNHDV